MAVSARFIARAKESPAEAKDAKAENVKADDAVRGVAHVIKLLSLEAQTHAQSFHFCPLHGRRLIFLGAEMPASNGTHTMLRNL